MSDKLKRSTFGRCYSLCLTLAFAIGTAANWRNVGWLNGLGLLSSFLALVAFAYLYLEESSND